VQVIAASILPKVAFSKDAFPNRRLNPSNRPSQTSAISGLMSRRGCCPWNSKRNNQAFVRSAVVSCAALSAFALNQTCLWNLYPDGLSSEITGHPNTAGANQPCSDATRKVVAPKGYSKRFFSI